MRTTACMVCLVLVTLAWADEKPGEGAKPEPVKVLARAAVGGKVTPPNFNDPAEQHVIRAEADLQRLGGKKDSAWLAKVLKLPAIDFKKDMVIQVTAGTRNYGGDRVEITGIELDEKARIMTVKSRIHQRPPDAGVTNAITHPGEIVLIQRFEGEVKFVSEK